MSTRDTPWPDGTPCWADLGAPDIAKAREFYSDVFSWTIQAGGRRPAGTRWRSITAGEPPASARRWARRRLPRCG